MMVVEAAPYSQLIKSSGLTMRLLSQKTKLDERSLRAIRDGRARHIDARTAWSIIEATDGIPVLPGAGKVFL